MILGASISYFLNNINYLIFVLQTHRVFFDARTELLSVGYITFVFLMLKKDLSVGYVSFW
jgi:hypothetical protein